MSVGSQWPLHPGRSPLLFRILLATAAAPPPPPPSPLVSILQLTVGIDMISFPMDLILPKLLIPFCHLSPCPPQNPILYFISICKGTNYVHSASLFHQSTFFISIRGCIPLLIDPGLPTSDPLSTRFPRRNVPLLSTHCIQPNQSPLKLGLKDGDSCIAHYRHQMAYKYTLELAVTNSG